MGREERGDLEGGGRGDYENMHSPTPQEVQLREGAGKTRAIVLKAHFLKGREWCLFTWRPKEPGGRWAVLWSQPSPESSRS